jgi:hypothetical protein
MKKPLLILLLTVNVIVSKAQDNSFDKQAIAMLKEFYTAYNTAWSTSKGYVLIRKLDSLQRKYCTQKLRHEVKESGLDHDPLIGDDYTDVEHLKTLKILKDPAKTDTYIVFYITHTLSAANKPIDEKVIIHVTVAKDNGTYKIASVK